MSYPSLLLTLTLLFNLSALAKPSQIRAELFVENPHLETKGDGTKNRIFRTGIGQASHPFSEKEGGCIVAGLLFEDAPAMESDSDGDVVFDALCNAITSLTHVPILGEIAIDPCHRHPIKESRLHLERALERLAEQKIVHIALTIEGQRPRFRKRTQEIRQSVANATSLSIDQVGITFNSGDEITPFGKGKGLFCFAAITTLSFEKPL